MRFACGSHARFKNIHQIRLYPTVCIEAFYEPAVSPKCLYINVQKVSLIYLGDVIGRDHWIIH